MGQAYRATCDGNVVGYMVLAVDSMSKEKQPLLEIDTFGNIPALLVASLATDERYERRGVATFLLSRAIKIAERLAEEIGCRVVLCNAEHDVVGFYEKHGFIKIDEHDGYVPMYCDLGTADPPIDT